MEKSSPSPSPDKKGVAEQAEQAESIKYELKYDPESVDSGIDLSTVTATGDGRVGYTVFQIIQARQEIFNKFSKDDAGSQSSRLTMALVFTFNSASSAEPDNTNSETLKMQQDVVEALTEPNEQFENRKAELIDRHLVRNKGKYICRGADGKEIEKQATKMVKVTNPDNTPPELEEPEKPGDSVPIKDLKKSERRALGIEDEENKHKKKHKNKNTSNTGASDEPDSAELRKSLEDLEKSRILKRQAYADKIKAPVYRKDKKADAQRVFRVTQRVYGDRFQESIETDIQDKIKNTSISEDDLRQYIENSVNESIATDRDAQMQAVIERYGKAGKALEWYANRKTWQKIAIGITASVAAGGVGVALGFFGGAIGAGAAAAGAGGMTFRGSRQYFTQLSEIFKHNNSDNQKFVLEKGMSRDDMVANAPKQARLYMEGVDNKSIEDAEKAKKKAVKWGLGATAMVGVGGLAGAYLHTHQDLLDAGRQHWLGGQSEHAIRDALANRDDLPGTPNKAIGLPKVKEIIPPPEKVIDLPEIKEIEPPPEVQYEEVLQVDSYIDSSLDAQNITNGEGWYQTFKELGMDPAERQAFLQNHGNELLNMRDENDLPIAYRMNNGDIGISRPGVMPRDVLEYITNTAHNDGYIEIPKTLVEIPAPTPTPEMWSEYARTITPNESISNTLTEFKYAGIIDSNISDTAFNNIVQETGLELSNYTYAYPYENVPVVYKSLSGEWRFNVVNGDGYMIPEEVLKILRKAALSNRFSLAA